MKKERTCGEKVNIFSKGKRIIGNFFYGISVRFHPKRQDKKSTKFSEKRKELLFYCAYMAIPIVQLLIFYVGVNLNSVLLAFKRFDLDTKEFVFSGWENFRQVFFDLSQPYAPIGIALKNSFILYGVSLCGVALSLLFSFYIYKKHFAGNFFRIVLFLPSIISTIVMVILFNYFVERALPEAVNRLFGIKMQGLLANSETRFGTILFFNIWVGFGTNILMYVSAMTRIPVEITEYATLDGISSVREFFKITLPLIYPTLSSMLVIGVANLFVAQGFLYEFYGDNLRDDSLNFVGYFLFRQVIGQGSGLNNYPYASAAGLLFTVIAAPLTLIVKWILEKFGPVTEY